MAKTYENEAQFLIVYIKEAHPSDDWASRVNSKISYIKDPTSYFERAQVANTCMAQLEINLPCLVDNMENQTARAYRAWPDRLFVVDKDGKLSYVGKPGPFGFLPREMEEVLKNEVGSP